jgi:hypothetical protein
MRLLGSILVVATLACAESLRPTPGQLLVGTWTSASFVGLPVTLTADANGASLATPCWKAQFASLRLSDSLTFRDTGVVTEAGGLVSVRVGDPYTLTGRVVGSDVVVNQQTLIPGHPGARVCNA